MLGSEKVLNLASQAAKDIKRGKDRCLRLYEAALEEVFGPDWKATWRDDTKAAAKLCDMEKDLKVLLKQESLTGNISGHYIKACRRHLLAGLPFKFSQYGSVDDLVKTMRMAETMPGNSNEDKFEQASRTIAAENTQRKYLQRAKGVGAIVVRPREGEEDLTTYCQEINKEVKKFGAIVIRPRRTDEDLADYCREIEAQLGNQLGMAVQVNLIAESSLAVQTH